MSLQQDPIPMGHRGDARMSAANALKQLAKRLRAKADTLDALVEAAEDMEQNNPKAEAALWQIVCESQRAR